MTYPKKRQTRVFKQKAWKCSHADAMFSKFIRNRDKWCRRCMKSPSTDNSHYWLRKHSGTRFDAKNCIGLCRPCHDEWEHRSNNAYKDFMVAWLGSEEYAALEHRARSFKNRREAILECMSLLQSLKHDRIGVAL